MQCKKCNALIPEGYMYCPKCGEEIIIVSDFEIKLEDNIDVAMLAKTVELPDVEKELNKEKLTAKTIDLETVSRQANEAVNAGEVSEVKDSVDVLDNTIVINPEAHSKLPKPIIAAIIMASIVLFIASVYGIVALVRYQSFDYQYNKAIEEVSAKDYEKAVKTLKHAISLEENKEARVLLADCYIAKNNYDAAIAVLFDTVKMYPDDYDSYDAIVKCYEKQGDSKGIHELIENSPDSTFALRYSDYVSIAPSFSLEGGTYIDPDSIKLTVPGEGTIYYTTDGSNPTKDSLEYIGAIPLEYGTTVITAININEKGIVSEAVSNTYVVEKDIADNPVLILPSGSYKKPDMIGIEIPEGYTAYFTQDGSTPSSDSRKYSSKLLMPLGKSTFSFIAYNPEGIASDVIMGEYDLKIESHIDTGTAEYAIKYQLTSLGEYVEDKSYKCNYGYAADNKVYYIIDEYGPDNKKTGRCFAVDTNSGELFTFDKATLKTNPL